MKVSVVVPVYGVEKYIERCVRSLFEQTLDSIEYIFIDDCSPDHSMEILERLFQEYRLRLTAENKIVRTVRMPTNSGQAAVRRHGIQLCTAQYVIHCDSDDWIDKDMYRQMYEKATADDSDIVITDYYRSDGVNHTKYRGIIKDCILQNGYLNSLLAYNCSTSVWNKLIRRDLYLQPIIYPTDNMWEDYALCVQLFYYAKKIAYLPRPYYYYYYNQNSICYSNIDKRQNQIIRNADLILNFLTENKVDAKHEIEMLKYAARNELVIHTGSRFYLEKWRNTYPEINRSIFFNKYLPPKLKLKYILIYIGLYGFVYKLKKQLFSK